MGNAYDKLLAVIVAIIIAAVMVPQAAYANPAPPQDNKDIPSDWAGEQVEKAKEMGLVPEGLQSKYTSSITREEFSELAVGLYEALAAKERGAGGESLCRWRRTQRF